MKLALACDKLYLVVVFFKFGYIFSIFYINFDHSMQSTFFRYVKFGGLILRCKGVQIRPIPDTSKRSQHPDTGAVNPVITGDVLKMARIGRDAKVGCLAPLEPAGLRHVRFRPRSDWRSLQCSTGSAWHRLRRW